MSEVLLGDVALWMGALVALTLLVLVGHAIGGAVRQKSVGPRVACAASALRSALAGTQADLEDVGALARLSPHQQIAVFSELSASLRGKNQQQLGVLATGAGLPDLAERWCASPRWFKRLRGARVYTLLGGGETAMAHLFDDPRPEVRAQAAQWAAEHPSPEVIDRLLTMLTDPHSLCRFTVQDSLLRIGSPAVPGLLRHFCDPSAVPSEEALKIATGIADGRFLRPALTLCRRPDPRLRAQAATLAASIGGAQVTDVLTGLLGDGDPDVRAAAANGLGKLAHWPAAGALSACLRDRSWDVRRGAALALGRCGAPGVLLLRRALLDDDRFARDMARQVLEVHYGRGLAQGPAPAVAARAGTP